MSIDRQTVDSTVQQGRTLIELSRRDDGTWLATQPCVDVVGEGETGALAAMEYCRKVARKTADSA